MTQDLMRLKIFPNDRKEPGSRQPDFRNGRVQIQQQVVLQPGEYSLSAWWGQTQAGNPCLDLVLQHAQAPYYGGPQGAPQSPAGPPGPPPQPGGPYGPPQPPPGPPQAPPQGHPGFPPQGQPQHQPGPPWEDAPPSYPPGYGGPDRR